MRFVRVIRVLPLIAALAIVSSARAVGVNLSWDECVGGGGSMMRTFTCDTNSGSDVLVASVVAPAGIDQWVSFETEIQLQSSGSAFPDWWRLRNQTGQLGQCRAGSLTSSSNFVGWAGCADVFAGQGAGGITTYLVGFNGANRARLAITYSVPSAMTQPLIEGQEYYSARVAIDHAKTVGSTACSGCGTSMCIICTYVRCLQPAGSPGGNVSVTTPATSAYAGWQRAYFDPCGGACVTLDPRTVGPIPCEIACPVRHSTWGALKSLYR